MRRVLLSLLNAYLDGFAQLTARPQSARVELQLLSGSVEYSFDALRRDGKSAYRSALLAFWDHIGELQPLAVYQQARCGAGAGLAGLPTSGRSLLKVAFLPLFGVVSVVAVGLAGLVMIWPERRSRRAMLAAFRQQWRQQLTLQGTAAPLLGTVALAIGLSWIAGGADDPVALSHVVVGVPLMGLWQMGVFRVGWVFEDERLEGTLDLLMTTQTPVVVVMVAKTLAIMASQAITATLALLILVGFAGLFVPTTNLPLVFGSALLAITGVIVVSLTFSPLLFLVGGRGGFFNAIMPAGTALSGFLYPTGLLPPVLDTVARVLPTSWAMEAVRRAVSGSGAFEVFEAWLAAAMLICTFAALTALLFRKAEERVRMTRGVGAF